MMDAGDINHEEQDMSALPDFSQIKARQQAVWASGDYAVVGTTLQIVGESLAEACDVNWGDEVLDVAAGNGNATLAAARRGASVTSTDYVPQLLERARERMLADRLSASYETADAEALPYANASFDVVLSTFGAMFAPDQRQVASEMLRVCRSGGRIGMANWTPDGFIGRIFKVIGRHVAPIAGISSPAAWGVQNNILDWFADEVTEVAVQVRHFNFRYRSPEHFVDIFRTWYGPMHKAFATLDGTAANNLYVDLIALCQELDCGQRQALVIPSEYLEVVAIRR